MRILQGKPLSPGYERGTCMVFREEASPSVPAYTIDADSVKRERDRFHEALNKSAEELQELQERVYHELDRNVTDIFSAHLALLKDEKFVAGVEERIDRDKVNAEQALQLEVREVTRMLGELENEYLRERSRDVRDLGKRILKHLGHGTEKILESIPPRTVLVAKELFPSETVNMDRKHVVAIVTERGGYTSHTAILARSLGIPAVTGIESACSEIPEGSELLVDGEEGTVTIAADKAHLEKFHQERGRYQRFALQALESEGKRCVTTDGTRVDLYANIGRPEEAEYVLSHRLHGVGLFRTEFLYLQMDREPDIDTQVEAYRRVCDTLAGLPVVVRTLDLAEDKRPGYLAHRFEELPNLGGRGLRFSLAEQRLFRNQIRALLRAGRQANLSLLFPMVTSSLELRRARNELERIAAEEGVTGLPGLAAMIETPAALFELGEILEMVDFVNIGTNDLAQYMFALDRNDLDLLSEESLLQPSLLRAVEYVVRTAEQKRKTVFACGEAAGNPATACLFVGLGVHRLSMSPLRSAKVKYTLRQHSRKELEDLAGRALLKDNAEEVRSLLQGLQFPPGEPDDSGPEAPFSGDTLASGMAKPDPMAGADSPESPDGVAERNRH